MAIFGFELDDIERLIHLVETEGLQELFVEEEDGRSLRISGRRSRRAMGPVQVALAPMQAVPVAGARRPARKQLPPGAGEALPENHAVVAASMVGVFYRSEKAGAPPFVEVGQHVTAGQTIGLIEAMKIFSEVPTDHSGRVVAIPGPDGGLVQSGDPLVIIEKDS